MTLTASFSGWFIDDLELPIAPTVVEETVLRKPDIKKIEFGFPLLFNPAPDSFGLSLKGWIFDAGKKFELYELGRSADTELIQVIDPDGGIENGEFAVARINITRDAPYFTTFLNTSVKAWKYEIVLVRVPGAGDTQDALEIGIDLDEDGIGFGDLDNIFDGQLDFSAFDPLGFLGIDISGL